MVEEVTALPRAKRSGKTTGAALSRRDGTATRFRGGLASSAHPGRSSLDPVRAQGRSLTQEVK